MGDRYYGEDYRLFAELQAHGCHFVVRLCEQAAVNVEEELAVDAAEHNWLELGHEEKMQDM